MTNAEPKCEGPPITDREALEQMRRGLCQQEKGLREQLQGLNQQISAIEKHLGIEKRLGR